MSGRRLRDLGAAAVVAAGVGALSQSSALSRLDGLSIDLLTWFRYETFGPRHTAEESRVAIIGLDEETYRRPPFADVPKALWTPQIATVIDTVIANGARTLGQDVILPTSAEGFLDGFDRPYLLALRRGAKAGRIVLGQVQHLAKPISPYSSHVYAVGGTANLRIVNLVPEEDGIIRRVPLVFTRISGDGERRPEASFAVELAARALDVDPRFPSPHTVALGERTITAGTEAGMLLNFAGGGRAIPVHSFADIAACVAAGHTAHLRNAFTDRLVIIGSVLDVEDRKLTSARYVTGPEGAWFAKRCQLPVLDAIYEPPVTRASIPGPFLYATAINNILRGEILRESGPLASAAMVAGAALALAWLTLRARLAATVAALAGSAILWIAGATLAFEANIVMPLLDPIAGAGAATVAMLGYRFAVTDRAKRQVQRAFSYYLPTTVVDRMVEQAELPTLGGETREVSIFMSDIQGFTKASEGLGPEGTVRAINAYFDAAAEVIEHHGGCVTMYLGDAIMAIFGAPIEDPDHARSAVGAALETAGAVAALGPIFGLRAGERLRVRVGIATGPALIGNIGSARRFNYTAMGDTVNLAARLESANKVYGTQILVCDETVARLGEAEACLPIERVQVQGRVKPVFLHQPFGALATLSDLDRHRLDVFREAARLRDAFAFGEARRLLSRLGSDPLAERLAEHLEQLAHAPAPERDPPVFVLSRN